MECITSGPMGTWVILLVPTAVGMAIGHWCHPIKAIRRARARRRIRGAARLGRLHRGRT